MCLTPASSVAVNPPVATTFAFADVRAASASSRVNLFSETTVFEASWASLAAWSWTALTSAESFDAAAVVVAASTALSKSGFETSAIALVVVFTVVSVSVVVFSSVPGTVVTTAASPVVLTRLALDSAAVFDTVASVSVVAVTSLASSAAATLVAASPASNTLEYNVVLNGLTFIYTFSFLVNILLTYFLHRLIYYRDFQNLAIAFWKKYYIFATCF